MKLDEKITTTVFKALCDVNRVRILNYLSDKEKCACFLLRDLDISQSTLSHHMKILIESGLVNARKQGKWTFYRVCKEGIDYAKLILDNIEFYSSDSENKANSNNPIIKVSFNKMKKE